MKNLVKNLVKNPVKNSVFVQGLLFTALTASSAFADVKGAIVLSDRDGDGKMTLSIGAEAAEEIYTILASPVQIGDRVIDRGYSRETSLKVGRDLTCTKTRYQRLPQAPVGPVGPGRGDWGRVRRPGLDAYTEYNCQTLMNIDGKIGLNLDRRRDDNPAGGFGPGPN